MRRGSIASMPSEETASRPVLLAVDDNPSVLSFVEGVLSTLSQKPEIITTANGEEALRRAEEASPDVIVMDWDMPVMDGLTAIRQLKANANTMDALVALAELPLKIRGFGPVKLANMSKAEKEREELITALKAGGTPYDKAAE